MTEITVAAQIQAFVEGRFPQGAIEPDKDIFSLGYINSLFAMELVMFIEKTFSVTVPNDELRIDNFRTVEAMSALVERIRTASMVG
jgi:acyl carrier protein